MLFKPNWISSSPIVRKSSPASDEEGESEDLFDDTPESTIVELEESGKLPEEEIEEEAEKEVLPFEEHEPEDQEGDTSGSESSEEDHGGEEVEGEVEDSPERESGEEGNGEEEDSKDSGEGDGEEDQLENSGGEGKSENAEEEESGKGSGKIEEEEPEDAEMELDEPEEEEDSEEEEGSEELESENEDTENAGGFNSNPVFDLIRKSVSDVSLRIRMFNALIRLSKMRLCHEDRGTQTISAKRALKRVVSKTPPADMYADYKKGRVSLILDTSGSCIKFADYFAQVAQVAQKFNFVDIYEAPNADVIGKVGEVGKYREEIAREAWSAPAVVFFGDIDGANIVQYFAKKTKVYWFCCENRYPDNWESHDWVGYQREEFVGEIFDCFDSNDLYKALPKLK